jgi:prolyl oligopeptidase
MKFLLANLAAAAAALNLGGPAQPAPQAAPQTAASESADPFLWLEELNGTRAMDWVRAENARTLTVLEADPRFKGLYDDALKIAEAKDRIPEPRFLDGAIFNFWQDSDHVRGVWRRTTLDDYKKPQPKWTTVLDLDAVAKAENANWVWKDADCAWPEERRCVVSLSDGGEDAVTVREFDLEEPALPATGGGRRPQHPIETSRFVEGGFHLPRGKQNTAWEDTSTLLISREWEPGQLTTAGYPFIVKRLKRGQPLSAAVEVFRGARDDGGYGVSPLSLHDGTGGRITLIERPLSTFEAEYDVVGPAGAVKLALPRKIRLQDMVSGRVVLRLLEDWTVSGLTLPSGALVSLEAAAMRADPAHLKPALIRAPGPRESIAEAGATRSHLAVIANENVRGRAFVYTPAANGGWTNRPIDLPDNSAIGLASTDPHSERMFLNVTSFLTPPTLLLGDAAGGPARVVKSLSAKFDASKDVVEQFEATSSDGTRIPYFLVHPKAMALDGSNPTILYAYGGFNASLLPRYSAIVGKLWLERGGVYVLANIRGGGEFGPAWHEAGLKTHRQIIYDDFTAVARDLVARKITSPRRLGIEGGSNGGLLMGVEFTQHPDLFRAVDIQVPLLDMLRFEQIQAGASWVGEYGSVSNPEERAFLARISPYANLKAGVEYPEPFIWTTTKDDRVGPQHARKFAAKLAAMHKPYLFYEVVEGGHGAGANLKETARTQALEMVYFLRKLMD